VWADNETTVDLLGFDYLVDSLEVVLTQPRLLPVTVGVLGDWGSGKTSLLQMVAKRLGASPGYVVVSFSPWRYQAYEDVKAALMDAVLTKVDERVPDTDAGKRSAGLVRRLRSKVARIMVGPAAAGRVLAPAAGSLIAAHEHLPPELGSAAASAAVLSLTAVRMVPVALALIGAGFDRNTVSFVGWFGPRGLASLVFALFALEELGTGADQAVAVVAVTVLLSVIAHGVSAAPLASRYSRATAPSQPHDPIPDPEIPLRGLLRQRGATEPDKLPQT
jgi:hypothetical protein